MSWERFFMKVGLFATNQQQLATDMVTALDDQIAMVELARDRGWNSLFTGQHYLNEGDNKQLQAVPFLARLPGGLRRDDHRTWHLVTEFAQSGLHGGDDRDPRCHSARQVRFRGWIGLSSSRVRCFWGAQGGTGAWLRNLH